LRCSLYVGVPTAPELWPLYRPPQSWSQCFGFFSASYSERRFLHSRGRRQSGAEEWVFAIGLVVAAAIYVGFAFYGVEPRWIAIEIGGVVLYGTLAWLGLRQSYSSCSLLWLSAGWALHPVWDVGLHLVGNGSVFSPDWCALICVTFDPLVAAHIAFRPRPAPAAADAV